MLLIILSVINQNVIDIKFNYLKPLTEKAIEIPLSYRKETTEDLKREPQISQGSVSKVGKIRIVGKKKPPRQISRNAFLWECERRRHNRYQRESAFSLLSLDRKLALVLRGVLDLSRRTKLYTLARHLTKLFLYRLE